MIPHIADALWLTDEESLSDALWALNSLTESESFLNTPGTILKETVGRLLAHMQSPNSRLFRPALECLGNISSGKDEYGLMLIGCGSMSVLKTMMRKEGSRYIRKEACWILSNLVSCGPLAITAFVDQGLAGEVRSLLQENDLDVMREAVWVASNSLVRASGKQLRFFVEEGLFGTFAGLLLLHDAHMRHIVLQTLRKVLKHSREQSLREILIRQMKENGTAAKVEELETCQNKVTAELAGKIRKDLEDNGEEMRDAEAGVIAGEV